MKAYVYTSRVRIGLDFKCKCIFIGEISTIPAKGTEICVVEGYSTETVVATCYSLYNDTVEIIVETTDVNNEYIEVRDSISVP